MNREIAVVYLAYIPYGLELFQSFLDSYIKHNAGVEHKLVVMFKDFEDEDDLNPFLNLLNSSGVKYQQLLTKGNYDIGSYFQAAERLDSEYIFFFNSSSIILADNWLSFYWSAMQRPHVGVVGATGGGWRSEFKNYLERNRGFHLKNFKSLMFMRLYFDKFTGPHLRTNAFFVKRKQFLSLKYEKKFLGMFFKGSVDDAKIRALYFEHGNQNMTHQFAERGLKALLIDRHGNVFEPQDWVSSKTFWISSQENLLVHDNKTLKYQDGDEQLRKVLSYEAWGTALARSI